MKKGHGFSIKDELTEIWMCKQTGTIFEFGKCGFDICPDIVFIESYFRHGKHWSQKSIGVRPSPKYFERLGLL